MLNTFRNSLGGLFGKILLALLVVSFAVWGIEDMLRIGGDADAPAMVGEREISREAFQRSYQREQDKLRQALGTNYSPEAARMFNLEKRVINELVMQELIAQETQALGLWPSDEAVVQEISKIEAFQNEQGQFDKELYYATLARGGMNEEMFTNSLRQQIATGLLLETIGLATPTDDLMVKTSFEAARQERAAQLAILTPQQIAFNEQPTEEQLERFYDYYAKQFTLPEYRTVRYFTVNEYRLLNEATASDEEIEQAYAEQKALFGDAEIQPLSEVRDSLEANVKRSKLEDIVNDFSIRLDDMLAGGATFDEVAREMGLELHSVGPIDRQGKNKDGSDAELPPYVQFLDTAFRTEESMESNLLSGKDNEYFMLYVDKVEEERVPEFKDIKDKVADGWKEVEIAKKLSAKATDLAQRAAKAPAPLPVLKQEAAQVQFSGMLTRDSEKTNTDLALPPALTEEMFSLKQGGVSKAYSLGDGRMAIAYLEKIMDPPALPLAKIETNGHAVELRDQLQASGREQLLQEYLAYLEKKYEVRINEAVLAGYAGGDA